MVTRGYFVFTLEMYSNNLSKLPNNCAIFKVG